METNNEYRLVPGFSNCFGTGWRVMADNFLRLFLVIIILAIITAPMRGFNWKFNASDLNNFHNWNFLSGEGHNFSELFAIGSIGIFAAFFVLLGLLYSFLIAPVFTYGGKMIFLQAVRRVKPDFEYLVRGFMQNYLNIILANLLVVALVVLGFFALIVPGIIIACRLSFVSFIVMDKKLDPIEAVELSWKLTKGHAWQIFFMAIASFFIIIFGLILLIIGIFPALIWVSSSFAALYESVIREKEPAAAVVI